MDNLREKLNNQAKNIGNKIKEGVGDRLASPLTKEDIADTISTQSYPLVVGAAIDYWSGVRGLGLLASRGYAAGINLPTGAPYGKWRNFVYRTAGVKEDSFWVKKSCADLVAFNTFQVPLYATVTGIGVFCSGDPTFEKVYHGAVDGARHLAMLSPIIAPTMGLWMDFLRTKVFKTESASQKSQRVLEKYG